MQRVERSMDQQANAYSLFQTAITLEGQVRLRTEEVSNALARLERTNDELTAARDTSERANRFKTRFFTAVGHDLAAAAARGAAFGQRARRAERRRAPAPPRRAHRARADDDRGAFEIDPRHFQARGGRHITRFSRGAARRSLRSSLLDIEPQARAKNLSLTWRRSGLAVVSDPLMLRRILQNLMANAVQYTDGRHPIAGAPPRGERSHRGVGHRAGHRRGRPRDDLRGVPARAVLGQARHRRLWPRAVDREAHGRDARTSVGSLLARRSRHALFHRRSTCRRR